jgi:mRNA-degrading endonuclease RelE of RelBE toxin-antitoxin system
MARVLLASEGRTDYVGLPVVAQQRVLAIFRRLEKWPAVSGAKPLRGEWAGCSRIRTGDWRVIFRPVGLDVVVLRIRHRKDVYED